MSWQVATAALSVVPSLIPTAGHVRDGARGGSGGDVLAEVEGGLPPVTAGGSVLVVGSLNADLVVSVGRLPRPGETVIGGTFQRHWGGKGANQAVAAARYGAEVTFLGAVGEDEDGFAALAALESEGIDTGPTIVVPDAPTGKALIVVDREGQNQIAVASGANLRLRARGLNELLATRRPGVVLTGFEVPDDAVADVAAARAAGWTFIVNPAPARPLDPRLTGSGAILTPNQGELRDLSGIEDPFQGARRLLASGPGGPVVVTLGEQGAMLVTGDGVTEVAAPSVLARDATGAGDVFNGVFAAALAQGETLNAAVCSGVAAASYAVELPGARAQLGRDELDARRAAAAARLSQRS